MWKMSLSVMTELLSVLIQVILEEGVAWTEQLSETRLPVVTVVFCGTAVNIGRAECMHCMCVYIGREDGQLQLSILKIIIPLKFYCKSRKFRVKNNYFMESFVGGDPLPYSITLYV